MESVLRTSTPRPRRSYPGKRLRRLVRSTSTPSLFPRTKIVWLPCDEPFRLLLETTLAPTVLRRNTWYIISWITPLADDFSGSKNSSLGRGIYRISGVILEPEVCFFYTFLPRWGGEQRSLSRSAVHVQENFSFRTVKIRQHKCMTNYIKYKQTQIQSNTIKSKPIKSKLLNQTKIKLNQNWFKLNQTKSN